MVLHEDPFGGFPKLGRFLGVLITSIIVFAFILGPPLYGNSHFGFQFGKGPILIFSP